MRCERPSTCVLHKNLSTLSFVPHITYRVNVVPVHVIQRSLVLVQFKQGRELPNASFTQKGNSLMTQLVYTTGTNSPEGIQNRSKWTINANGSLGTLELISGDNRILTGFITFPDTGGRIDTISGGWDDAGRKISFTRTLPGNAVQVFEGLLGDNRPGQLILAGSLDTCCGWVAFSPIPIV